MPALSNIRNVVVISAGNIGHATVKALLKEGFNVTVVTSQSSKSIIPAGATHIRSDYSGVSLLEAFKGQDCVVSTINGTGLPMQATFIDKAIEAGVQLFLPSEFGVDTSVPECEIVLPLLEPKIQILKYLKARESQISWTAIVSGSLFDWALDIPGFGGIDVKAGTATIYDGGKQTFDATSVAQVGRAIALALKQPQLVQNQSVFINSFAVCQAQVVRALEKATGKSFKVLHETVEQFREFGTKKWQGGDFAGMLALIAATVYGAPRLSNYSASKGLWNARLRLEGENLESFVQGYVNSKD